MSNRLRKIFGMTSALALAVVPVALTGCNDDPLITEAASGDALSAQSDAVAAAASMSANRTSWNNWHVHDGTAPPYTDETGLTHLGFAVFPQIFEDYATTPSRHAYCPDGIDKGLVGGDGGSKKASGTCQNEDNLIHLQNNANGAPGPAGWTALPPGPSFTVYYRLTPR